MKRLPYIDEHDITVAASRDDTWAAVLAVMCRNPDDPSTVPIGFVVDVADHPVQFAMKGRHLFAVYRLVFELDDLGPRSTRVRAQTWAAFPGLHGRVYKALVIGSGAHKVVVRRMLRRISDAAGRASRV